MKKRDCIHMEDVVEGYTRQDGNGNPYQDYELVDEICTLEEDNPLHYDEYDCEGCKYYHKEKTNER